MTQKACKRNIYIYMFHLQTYKFYWYYLLFISHTKSYFPITAHTILLDLSQLPSNDDDIL